MRFSSDSASVRRLYNITLATNERLWPYRFWLVQAIFLLFNVCSILFSCQRRIYQSDYTASIIFKRLTDLFSGVWITDDKVSMNSCKSVLLLFQRFLLKKIFALYNCFFLDPFQKSR